MEHRVLVVDDSSTVRQQLTRALTLGGFSVLEAVDGQDALEKLSGTETVSSSSSNSETSRERARFR